VEAGHFEIFAALSTLIVTMHKLQVWRTKKMHKENQQMLGKLIIEHEMIIEDYCDRKGIEREALPTRHPNVLNGG
jgi:hypothetical protein